MKHRVYASIILLLLVIPFLTNLQTFSVETHQGQLSTKKQATVIHLLRHAEKVFPMPPNPPLSETGKARAIQLANILANSEITNIYSTNFKRTLETVQPLAEALNLKIESYNPRALDDFARQLRTKPGRHLVVGHSNSTPELVTLLGGEAGPDIDEKREFDRLYILVLDAGGNTTTIQQRYGVPSERQ